MKIHNVPAYSQHLHIQNPEWHTRSCGIVSLGMVLAYHGKNIPLDELLAAGLTQDAYIAGIGWKHADLVELAKRYNLQGKNLDWAHLDDKGAFENLYTHLERYPILASIYQDFDQKKGGHLVVLTGLDENNIFVHDPDARAAADIAKSMPHEQFLRGWKKRIIIITPH